VRRSICGLAAMLIFLGPAHGQGQSAPSHPYDAYLAPGKGIPSQQIEGVYHHWNWMMMLNAGMIDTGSDYILFKNGEVWRHPQLPPQDIDVAKAKHLTSTDWGSWQRAGNVTVIRMPGGHDERYEPAQLVRYEAAPKNEHVEGSWHTTLSYVSNAGGHSTTGVSNNTLTLHADGRFIWDSFSGAGFQNSTGSTRTGGTFTNPRPVHAGHYHIDGYTLELNYDDGRVERDLFYWAGGPNKRYDLRLLNGKKYTGALKH
jgi:hypothetical protein